MKKSEMEDHHDEYLALEGRIHRMSDNREFPAVFSACVESFPHVVPAISSASKRVLLPKLRDCWLLRLFANMHHPCSRIPSLNSCWIL